MELELKRFDMRSIEFHNNPKSEGPVIVMIGKRGSGKSVLVKDLLFYHKDIPIGTVISGTEIGNKFYADLVPRILIYHTYQTAIIEKALRRQLKVKQDGLSDARAFVILDDCLFDDKWTRDKLMRLIFMNGRHWKMMLIITMQHPLGIPPNLRTNVDYTFIMRENIIGNRKRLFDNYAGAFPSFEYFCQVLDNTTENYECLVVKNGGDSNKLNDQIFWYKSELHQPFRMGSKELWDLSESMVFEDEDIFKDNIDKKVQKVKINVKKVK